MVAMVAVNKEVVGTENKHPHLKARVEHQQWLHRCLTTPTVEVLPPELPNVHIDHPSYPYSAQIHGHMLEYTNGMQLNLDQSLAPSTLQGKAITCMCMSVATSGLESADQSVCMHQSSLPFCCVQKTGRANCFKTQPSL